MIWSDFAIENLEHIAEYIEIFDPSAAKRLAVRLIAVSNSLSEFPNRGRPAPQGMREITTLSPYIIRYSVTSGQVKIVGIRHSARLAEED